MGKQGWKPGIWSAICDRCGFEYNSDQIRTEWTGLKVCSMCWEARHPQDLIRVQPEKIVPPWTRPEAEDAFTQVCNQCTSSAYAGLAAAGCAIVGNEPSHELLDTYAACTPDGWTWPDSVPAGCYREVYENGLDDFTYTLGSDKNNLSVVSSPYGPAFYAASTTTTKYIRKSIASIVMRKLSFYLWLDSYSTGWDDAAALRLSSSDDTEGFSFRPVREWAYDSGQLTHVASGSVSWFDYTLPSPKLPSGVWYYVEVIFDPAATSYAVTIYDATTMAVVKTATLYKNMTGLVTVAYEEYQVEYGYPNVPTKYARVQICDSIV